jgi:hypothetical protein
VRSALFLLVLAVAWSWPLVLSPGSSTISLHFDQFPAAWLAHAAAWYVPDGVCELSAWPAGEAIVRLDSFLYLALATVLGGAVPGLLLTNLFVLLGPPVSALAACRFVRRVFGIGELPALVAGIAFGFAPLATVAALEGHVYYLLDPWLPLCALAAWEGRPVATVVHWTLALLTTAYLGIDASIVVIAVMVARRRLDPRALAGIATVGLAYVALYAHGRGGGTGAPVDAVARLGSATLTTLVAWSPWLDLARHSLGPALGVVPLAVAALSPWSGVAGWRPWLFLGLLATGLCLGPVLELGVSRGEALPTPLYPLLSTGLFDLVRFPIRLAWVATLAFGGVAAAVASRTRWPGVLVALMVADVLVFSGARFRFRPHPAPVPALYDLLPEGAVLDVFPEVGGPQEDMAFYQQNLACYYQLGHRRPILDRCLNTEIRQSPRRDAGAALAERVLGDVDPTGWLRERGIASVVLHADAFQPFERAAWMTGLGRALGPPVAEGRDGGEWLVAWAVPS